MASGYCTAAAATAKSLQSCPTLWDPIDGSPPGSPVPGILLAKFRTVLSQVFQYIKYSGDLETLTALLAGDAEFRHLDRMSAEVINVVTGSNLEFKNEGGEVDVCKAIEQIRENAMTEGAKQGAKYGEEKGILNSIRNLMETTSWTAQAAMDALKIPEADRAGYLAKL